MTAFPLAELDDLRVRFGAGPDAMEAVRGVSLSVEHSEVLCLLARAARARACRCGR